MSAIINSPVHALTALDRIRRTLAKSVDLSKIKDIRDEAEAIRYCVKTAALGLQKQNQATEVKLVAERRAGALLKELGLHGGDRKSDCRKDGPSLEELGISKIQSARWQREASLPEEDFQLYLRQARQEGKELTSQGLLRLARLHAVANPVANRTNLFTRLACKLKDLARERSQFSCIYVNPPWPTGRTTKLSIRRFVEGLAELPVKPLAAKLAHLHVRATPELLDACLKLLSAWGFRYQTLLVRKKDLPVYGRYWQQAHEMLLLGERGGLEVRDCTLPSWIDEHLEPSSELLSKTYDFIERVSPGPYLELFGDRTVTGWTVLGASGSTILAAR